MTQTEVISIIIGSIIEGMVYILYLSLIMERRYKFIFLVLPVLLWAFVLPAAFRDWSGTMTLRTIANVVYLTIMTLTLFKGSLKERLMAVASWYMGNVIISLLSLYLFGFWGKDISDVVEVINIDSALFRLVNIIGGVIAGILIFKLMTKNKAKNSSISRYFMVTVVSDYFMFVFITHLALCYNINRYLMFGAFTVITAMSLGFTVMAFKEMEKEHNKELAEKAFGEQYKRLKEQYASIARSYTDLKKMRHDFKNHLLAMSALSEHGENEKLQSYIESIRKDLSRFENMVFCKNPAVNVILASKYSAAQEEGLNIKIEYNLGDTGIDDIYLCSVISNLLQNAVENTPRGGEIEFSAYARAKNAVLVCKNTVKSTNTTLITAKDDKENHGYGIGIIRTIADNLGGSSVFEYRGLEFNAVVSLPIKEESYA